MIRSLIFLCWSFFFLHTAYAQFQVPPLSGPVMDSIGVMTPQSHRDLTALLHSFNQAGKAQVQVLIVDSLQGEPIEVASLKTVEAWKLGRSDLDNGVLLFVSIQDRRLRIEVGQGLEGDLTDLKSKRIIADTMTPLLKAKKTSAAIVAGVYEIIQTIDPNFIQNNPDFKPVEKKKSSPFFILGLLLFILFFGRLTPGRHLRGGRSGWPMGGGWGGGSSGGFGGGWSGGGGGFSGGGASGSW